MTSDKKSGLDSSKSDNDVIEEIRKDPRRWFEAAQRDVAHWRAIAERTQPDNSLIRQMWNADQKVYRAQEQDREPCPNCKGSGSYDGSACVRCGASGTVKTQQADCSACNDAPKKYCSVCGLRAHEGEKP